MAGVQNWPGIVAVLSNALDVPHSPEPPALPSPPYVNGTYPSWPASRFYATIANGLRLFQIQRLEMSGGPMAPLKTAAYVRFMLDLREDQVHTGALEAISNALTWGMSWSKALEEAAPKMDKKHHGDIRLRYWSQLAVEEQTKAYFARPPASYEWPYAFQLGVNPAQLTQLSKDSKTWNAIMEGVVRIPFEFRPVSQGNLAGDQIGAFAVSRFCRAIGLAQGDADACGQSAVVNVAKRKLLASTIGPPQSPFGIGIPGSPLGGSHAAQLLGNAGLGGAVNLFRPIFDPLFDYGLYLPFI